MHRSDQSKHCQPICTHESDREVVRWCTVTIVAAAVLVLTSTCRRDAAKARRITAVPPQNATARQLRYPLAQVKNEDLTFEEATLPSLRVSAAVLTPDGKISGIGFPAGVISLGSLGSEWPIVHYSREETPGLRRLKGEVIDPLTNAAAKIERGGLIAFSDAGKVTIEVLHDGKAFTVVERGSDVRLYTATGTIWALAIAPDSSRFAVAEDVETEKGTPRKAKIVLLQRNGGKLAEWTPAEGFYCSPAFVSRDELFWVKAWADDEGIWFVDLRKERKPALLTKNMWARSLAAAPDGSRLAFTGGANDKDDRAALWLIHPDGSGLRKLSPSGGSISFSSEGTRLLLVGYRNAILSFRKAASRALGNNPSGALAEKTPSHHSASGYASGKLSVRLLHDKEGMGAKMLLTSGEVHYVLRFNDDCVFKNVEHPERGAPRIPARDLNEGTSTNYRVQGDVEDTDIEISGVSREKTKLLRVSYLERLE